MGLFDLFGSKKKEAENEAQREAALQQSREQKIQQAQKDHEGMEWPTVPRFNNIVIGNAEGNVPDAVDNTAQEMVSPERKDPFSQEKPSPELYYQLHQGHFPLHFLSLYC